MVLPYPIASVVQDSDGDKYLVSEISENLDYSLLGHKNLGTEGQGMAWEDHDDYTLIEEPSEKTWEWLIDAREHEYD